MLVVDQNRKVTTITNHITELTDVPYVEARLGLWVPQSDVPYYDAGMRTDCGRTLSEVAGTV